jgi:hypothetical protein
MQLFHLDKIYALPKYLNTSISSTHLIQFHCFFSSSFSPVGDMTVSSPFSFCTHRHVCSFLFQFPPMHLVFLNLVKMHRVLRVPNYFFSFIKFVKFYDILLSPLHFTNTKTLKKRPNTTDSHHSSRQKHQE